MSKTLLSIQKVLNQSLGVEPDSVTIDSTFDSLQLDSLDMVELISELEDECNVEFGDSEPEGMTTVGDLIAYIDSYEG